MNERGLRHVGRVVKHARPGRVRRAPTRLVEYQNQKKNMFKLEIEHFRHSFTTRRTCRERALVEDMSTRPRTTLFRGTSTRPDSGSCTRIPRRRAREILRKAN